MLIKKLMKPIKINLVILGVLMFLHMNLSLAEGFIAGTEIKTRYGYAKIEDLYVGDSIMSNDINGNRVESQITYIDKKTTACYSSIKIGDHIIDVSSDQLFYKEDTDSWVVANSLNNGDVLNGQAIIIDHINRPVEVYLLSIAHYHNFFVTKNDICAHNFFPPIVLAISAAFGLGSVELAGISFGLAGAGSFLCYKWHKSSKSKHTLSIESQFYGNGMMPEDPEKEKKEKERKLVMSFNL